MTLRNDMADAWTRFQDELFPSLEEQVGPLGDRQRCLLAVCPGTAATPGTCRRTGGRLPGLPCQVGVEPPDRAGLLDRLHCDIALRRLCGWHHPSGIPSGATFSRALPEFAEGRLPERMHGAPVGSALDGAVVGHIPGDSSAISGRGRPAPKP